MESYLSKWANVFASVMSLTATNWISLSSSAVRTMLRPMRPNPLKPTLMGILPPLDSRDRGSTRMEIGHARTRNAIGCVGKSQRARNEFRLQRKADLERKSITTRGGDREKAGNTARGYCGNWGTLVTRSPWHRT